MIGAVGYVAVMLIIPPTIKPEQMQQIIRGQTEIVMGTEIMRSVRAGNFIIVEPK